LHKKTSNMKGNNWERERARVKDLLRRGGSCAPHGISTCAELEDHLQALLAIHGAPQPCKRCATS
jgi:hypothetical protein